MKRADPDALERSVGIRVDLPFEHDVNAFVTNAYQHRTFFTHLHQFVLMSDAFVVVPGGIGTVLEAMMIWQLLQVGHLQGTPLILTGKMYAESTGAGSKCCGRSFPWPAARIWTFRSAWTMVRAS